MLDAAAKAQGTGPKHIISDQGSQFQEEYLAWCEKRGALPRFGAVGQHRSIAVIERFWRTLKEEWWRRLASKPWLLFEAKPELEAYLVWYHELRPHQGLGGRTPASDFSRSGRSSATPDSRDAAPRPCRAASWAGASPRDHPARLTPRRRRGKAPRCGVEGEVRLRAEPGMHDS
jgi:hypothetical protein